jgi:hypothetical protein
MLSQETTMVQLLRELSFGPKTADEIAEVRGEDHCYTVAPILTRMRKRGLIEWNTSNGSSVMRETRLGGVAKTSRITAKGINLLASYD